MTQQTNGNVLQAAVELLNEDGFEAYAQVLRILLNEAINGGFVACPIESLKKT